MKQNIEIKARAHDFARQQKLASAIATEAARLLIQHDTFYNTPAGRLKLRRFADGAAELIQYDRIDESGTKTSNYVVAPVAKHELMHECLTRALGIRVSVRKRRTLIMAGRTRMHFDEVEGLGQFIELEVVLQDRDDHGVGRQEARQIMRQLDIREEDLIECAYADLLLRPTSAR